MTLASVTFQNYFRLYEKLAGMTGTAATEADEFFEIYKLGVVEVPTNMPVIRDDNDDQVFRTAREKYAAIVEEITRAHAAGQPILVGTTSIEKSENLSAMLKTAKIPHNVLNARYHEQEAQIIAEAGVPGAVTIATNMAGRGTDIQLGGNVDMRVVAELEAAEKAGAPRRPGRAARAGRGRDRRRQGAGHRRRRALRARHRAPREPAHRQPAPRPLRPPGRPGPHQLLPLPRGRPDADLRLRAARLDARPARDEGGRGDRPPVGEQGAGEGARQGRGAQLRHPQEPAEVRRRDERPAQGDLRPAPRDHGGRRTSPTSPATCATRWSRTSSPSTCRRAPTPTSGTSTASPRRSSQVFGLEPPLAAWADEEGVDDEVIRERLTAATDEHMAAKAARYGAETMRAIEKQVLLQTIDSNWREHLVTLDHLRSVVGFRGYAQRDPLNEYKSEAFQLFEGLLNRLRSEVTRMLAHVQVMTPEEQQAMIADLQARAAGRRPPATPSRRAAAAPASPRWPAPPPGARPRRRPRRPRHLGLERPQRPLPLRLRQEVQALPRQGVSPWPQPARVLGARRRIRPRDRGGRRRLARARRAQASQPHDQPVHRPLRSHEPLHGPRRGPERGNPGGHQPGPIGRADRMGFPCPLLDEIRIRLHLSPSLLALLATTAYAAPGTHPGTDRDRWVNSSAGRESIVGPSGKNARQWRPELPCRRTAWRPWR